MAVKSEQWFARSTIMGRLVSALIVACVALLIEFVTEGSPFSEMARHLAARLFAPYNAYGYGFGAEARRTTDRIAMVDLGTATLQRYRTAWPITYGQHARVLERIRQARPQAVFVDFRFESPRPDPTLGALMVTLCAFKAEGIPVFLAAGSQTTQGLLRPELEALRDASGAPCFQKVAVDYEPSVTDRIAWTYPLQSQVGQAVLPSAALAMAQAVTPARLLADSASDAVMGLVWGGGPSDNGPRWAAPAGDTGRYCKGASWTDLLPLQTFLMRLTHHPIDQRPHCPLHRSIEAGELTAPGSAGQVQARLGALRDKLVFYGGSFDANDFVASPLQGDVPGVYLHAQAADNLLRYGPAWRHTQIGGRFGHAYEWPMTFVALLAMALLAAAVRALLRRGGRWALDKIQAGARTPACRRVRIMGKRTGRWLRKLLPVGWGSWRLATSDEGAPMQYDMRQHGTIQDKAIQRARRHMGKKLHHVGGSLMGFYISLLVAFPVAWLLIEPVFHVSVIGYSSILALCLLGELFADMADVEGERHDAHQAGGTRQADLNQNGVGK